jgi:hypothetical protein
VLVLLEAQQVLVLNYFEQLLNHFEQPALQVLA